MWLVILSLVLPPGIGISLMENNIDINKLLTVGSVVITFIFVMKKSWSVKIDSVILFSIIFSILLFSWSWLNSTQYLYFTFYVFMYFFQVFVAKFIFSDVDIFVNFTNNLARCLIFFGIFSLIQYHFKFNIFEYFRPLNEAFITINSRGEVLGHLDVEMYKGFEANRNWYAFSRFILLSWCVFGYTYSFKLKGKGLNSNVLLVSSLLGILEIILTQARVHSVLAILLFFVLIWTFLMKSKLELKIFYSLGIASILIIIALVFREYVVYFLANIYSVFDFYEIEALKTPLTYSYVSDKRGQAVNALMDGFRIEQALMPLGPLFYMYTDSVLGVPSEYFDDLSPMLTSLVEFGLVGWTLMSIFTVYAVVKKKGKVGMMFTLLLMATIISSMATFAPKFYFFYFFFIGAILSRSARVEL